MATKKQIAEYTAAALDGFNGVPHDASKHGMLTSGMHACYVIGEHFKSSGRPEPSDVRPGRGDLVNVRDMKFRLNWMVGVRSPAISREA